MKTKLKKKYFVDVMKVFRERWLKKLRENINVENIKFIEEENDKTKKEYN